MNLNIKDLIRLSGSLQWIRIIFTQVIVQEDMREGRVSGLKGLPEGCVQVTRQERNYKVGKNVLGSKSYVLTRQG